RARPPRARQALADRPSMRSARLAPLFAAGLFALAAPSSARPSIWRRVTHPNLRVEEQLLPGLERMLDRAEQVEADQERSRDFARAAVAMLDLKRVREPEDPRFAWVMAHALLAADVGRTEQAERILERVLPELPEGTLRARALRDLGRARAELGH